ncbi:MAG: hypothetical protein JSS68_01860 [Actinobacteria bacterium]|nr:hypothetical protein [Actinomycetota bacterium]MBS1884798.1 hypothetical protein [Actinomycetota bacterium]
MTTLARILRAVTLRRVLGALLIGAFAREIVAALSWLADTGRQLKDVAALRGPAVAGLRFALQGALIYLALRAVAAALDRRHVRPMRGLDVGPADEHETATAFEGGGPAADGRSREGGRDGDGPDEDQ